MDHWKVVETVLDDCKESYEYICSIDNLPSGCQILRVRLRLESHHFHNWKLAAGLRMLSEYCLDRLRLGFILGDINDRMQNLKRIHCLYEKHASTGHKECNIVGDMFDDEVIKLTWLNLYLESLMEEQTQGSIQKARHQTYMTYLQRSTTVEYLSELAAAMTLTSAQERAVTCGIRQSVTLANRGERQSFTTLLSFKAFHISINTRAEYGRKTMCLDDFQIPPDKSLEQRVEAIYNNSNRQHVWIQWLNYDVPSNESRPLLVESAERLAALLSSEGKPKELHAPDCLGCFDDIAEQRIGFVFARPANVPSPRKPLSLLSLLTKEPEPSVMDRIALGHSIAKSILYLHSVDWLHRGLGSHNIIFFDSSSIFQSFFYLSGFDCARPPAEERTLGPHEGDIWKVYQHRCVQAGTPGGFYKKFFDIYSLGIVLLEIACWRPVSELLGIADLRKAKSCDTIKTGESLRQPSVLRMVGKNAGAIYEEVVRVCLDFAEMGGMTVEEEVFQVRVIDKLEKLLRR